MFRSSKPEDLNSILLLNREFFLYTIDRNFDPELKRNKALYKKVRTDLKNRVLHPRKNNQTPVFVVEKNNRIIGYATGWILKNKSGKTITNAVLENIFITVAYRKGGPKYVRGTGAKLLNKFRGACRKNKSHKINVDYYTTDSDAENFYLSKSAQFSISKEKARDPNKTRLEFIIKYRS